MCCSSTDDTRTLARINSASVPNTTKANVCTVPGYTQRHRCAGSGHEGMMGKKGTNALAACFCTHTHTHTGSMLPHSNTHICSRICTHTHTHTHTHIYAGTGLGHTERQQATWQGHNTHSAWSHTHKQATFSHTNAHTCGICTQIPTSGSTKMHTCKYTHTHTHTHTRVDYCRITQTHIVNPQKNTCTQAQTTSLHSYGVSFQPHTHTYTHTHTHTHTLCPTHITHNHTLVLRLPHTHTHSIQRDYKPVVQQQTRQLHFFWPHNTQTHSQTHPQSINTHSLSLSPSNSWSPRYQCSLAGGLLPVLVQVRVTSPPSVTGFSKPEIWGLPGTPGGGGGGERWRESQGWQERKKSFMLRGAHLEARKKRRSSGPMAELLTSTAAFLQSCWVSNWGINLLNSESSGENRLGEK